MEDVKCKNKLKGNRKMKIGNLEVYGVIYKITNKINNKVYIGQTTRDKGFNGRYCYKGIGIERVYNYHKDCKDKENDSLNSHLLFSIEKYGFENFEVNEIFDIAFSKQELDIKEICWISIFDSYKNGYNQNKGGKGNKGHRALKGRNNPTSKMVVQLTLNGDFIKIWDTMTEAIKSTNTDKSSMIRSCKDKNKRNSANGFLWVYYNEYNNLHKYKKKEKRKNVQPIIQLDKFGRIIKEYKSIKDACNKNGFHYTSLVRCCNGNRNTYKGYKWIYANK
ncbi:NUMOD1 domain-containing DNA-binding protein [Clostridium sp. KO2]|uniref:NUMOD1 domain-containing DNA-binding protein n=1 Tax=Clostridium sp. KO2 TaxID=2949985 RepID=UPI00207AE296|nr:NUMOD1 domain-containing DNA-binding protein [Clostridium sp. KO2]